ncbi:benzoate/H(+) symporter BenE family transporter [Paenibacillus sp. GCM10027627]|uniref:benzoate/H(+) symporter BenE family transporter n=1 Tax=unclassified Paenibacillus TaxID=185978 RepID=UPI0036268117
MGIHRFTTGVMSALLACTGGAIMVVQAANAGGLERAQLLSWFMAVYVIGGALNLALTLKYKVPFAGAHSITAAAFIGTMAAHVPFAEMAGGFILSGVIIFVAGCTGWFAKALAYIPKNVIDGLLAGLLLPYVLKIPSSIGGMPLAGLLALAAYFLLPVVTKVLPPAIWAILFGFIGLLIENGWPKLASFAFSMPVPVMPAFSAEALFSIAVPISLLVMSNDLAVAFASLKNNGYEPPVTKSMVASGIAGMAAGLFGGHAANIGGMMSAVCSSEEAGKWEGRYGAAVVSSVIVIGFGLLSWKVIPLIQWMPVPFVALMTGFSLLGIFWNSIKSTTGRAKGSFPAIAAFAVAAFQVNLFGISAPVWALLAGVAAIKLVSWRKRLKA